MQDTIRVFETIEFAENKFALKVRATFRDETQFQIYLYINKAHVDYSYQLFQSDEPILRWDNKEHYPKLSSYPHHFHSVDGDAQSSPLTGNPQTDLMYVLDYLSKRIKSDGEPEQA